MAEIDNIKKRLKQEIIEIEQEYIPDLLKEIERCNVIVANNRARVVELKATIELLEKADG